MIAAELEATHLQGRGWAVRPKGQLGTMGWHPFPWDVVYVNAGSAEEAIRKALPELSEQAKRHNDETP